MLHIYDHKAEWLNYKKTETSNKTLKLSISDTISRDISRIYEEALHLNNDKKKT